MPPAGAARLSATSLGPSWSAAGRAGRPWRSLQSKDDPGQSRANDFIYRTTDPDGLGCPFGSHIRRGNPRDTLGEDAAEALKLTKRHRLIRRGRSYGPRASDPLDLNDKQERGLMFMIINANIERQFEFVQQTWINSPSFHGLYDERDPIFGSSVARRRIDDDPPATGAAEADEPRWLCDRPRRSVLFLAQYQGPSLPRRAGVR